MLLEEFSVSFNDIVESPLKENSVIIQIER